MLHSIYQTSEGRGQSSRLIKIKLNKDNSSKDVETRRKPPSQQVKGGLRDRPLFSWVRILGEFFYSFPHFFFLFIKQT